MTTPSANAVLLTGCTGAIGSHILRRLLGGSVNHVFGTFSRPETYARLRAALPQLDWTRFKPIYVDLRSDRDMAALDASTAGVRPEVIIHTAANVSWTKSEGALQELNVGGTRRIAAWAAANSPGSRLIAFSTAFAHRPGGHFLNGYERTKREAEIAVIGDYGDRLRIGIVRPSLAIGDSTTGEIGRFNGFYPLVRVVAFGEVPCVIGDPEYPMDLVPVDWIVDDVMRLTEELNLARQPLVLTTASGSQSLTLREVMAVITDRLNAFLAERGIALPPAVTVITPRQFDFLVKAASSWNLEHRFEQANRVSLVMSGYLNHSIDPIRLSPTHARSYPGGAKATIARCISFWLAQHEARLCTPRENQWSESTENA